MFMLGSLRLFLCGLFAVVGVAAHSAELSVLRVDFDLVRQEGARDPWYEVAIAVSVERGEERADANPRFADAVSVSLALATEVNREAGVGYEFYSARAEYPTLEVGQHVVRFYLPPELVKRDRVKGEPFAYEIEVISPEGVEASLVSRNLERSSALQSFHSQLDMHSATSSALRLQSGTPFAWTYPRDTPNAQLSGR